MIKKLAGEAWKSIVFPGWKNLRNRYALSSHGRIASYKQDILEDGKILNGSLTTGYRTLNLHRSGSKGTLYIHREIAKVFLSKPSTKHDYVVHINHNKLDNGLKNLKWATAEQMILHQQKSPAKIAYKAKQAARTQGLKLNASDVKKIRSAMNNKQHPMTIKKIAAKFSISEMTVYRIKRGENWSQVK